MPEPTIDDIRAAAQRIQNVIHRTPVLTCATLDRLCDANIYFKCENFQKTGSFKIRGAANAVFSLSPEDASRGVATHSSGNHAAAVALAARLRGITAYVVMPRTAPRIKKNAVAGYGAEIVFCEPTLAARQEGLAEIVRQTGAVEVHPYNNYDVMAGQGTSALELCEEVGNLDAVVAPIGGGGLLSGTAIALSSISPATKVIGAEPANADDAARSLQAGKILPAGDPVTIADGLRTGVGTLTFPVIKQLVSDIITAEEELIAEALLLVWERMKVVIEPSSAVPLAVLLRRRGAIPGRRIGIILSGGNVDIGAVARSLPANVSKK
ncbi:MAG: pyridoxal-phosphate dependent enzyme [Candidatus Abyssobacteria bacterium SURF_5]|uniref:Pyridoxal-phosphate dependent enzyme n=1 Tax=Abyssobacteria bacterium (strain SURF_5) TaxID=2093360 RepID=A0A3A4P5J1_ABYX5|nr:MAG: pyridoxal-phosphate dependent enzyme [Candidatus Abyssubacteria bacterium SURF_5]